MKKNTYIILKYGGTSVASASQWKSITATCKQLIQSGVRPFLVCSALSGISNLLLTLINQSVLNAHQKTLSIIREKHFSLIGDMGLKNEVILASLDELERLAEEVALSGSIDPATRARVMSFGELLVTRIGQAWLSKQDLNCDWLDAREHLRSVNSDELRREQHYLAAQIQPAENASLQKLLENSDAELWITQGFIAADQKGTTVLLGRGGSDTSAALFAVAIGAQRLEIWTDVPGMFTANPRQIDSARLIVQLNYAEAQELATTGAKVLHPACLGPVAQAGIPLSIRWTGHPDIAGTVICAEKSTTAGVKGISSKSGIWLISMESFAMWQHAGFLADIFTCFKQLSISIDLISTSESNVTVSLDSNANVLGEESLGELLAALSEYCEPRVIGPVATVTLVGNRIRSILHRLGPAFSLFEDKHIYLLSQSASDLNLSIATGEDEADQLVELLHNNFFAGAEQDEAFGPTWKELIP